MKKKEIITATIALLQLVLLTSTIAAAEPEYFSNEFHQPLDQWINGEMSSEELFEEMKRLDSILEEDPAGWENLYWRSRTAMIRGQIYYENKEKKKSVAELENCQSLMHRSISMMDYSDSWRILAESSSLIMIQKDLFYIIKNFSRSQEEAGKALELDPQNVRATLVIAQFLGNAPKIAGGNREEAIELLKNSSNRGDLIDEDMFYTLMSLSEIQKKDRKFEAARKSCSKALRLFPGNINAQNLLTELQERK